VDPTAAERRLAAILSADVVGYTRLMADDEAATIRAITDYREEIAMLVRQHRGRVVDAPGDNLLAEFPTALHAVHGAVEIQRVIGVRNADLPAERRMEFRIGVHLGDVAVEGDRIYGDGVNLSARLQGLAEPGGICISGEVHGQIRHKLDLEYENLGEQQVKNLPDPVHVFRVKLEAQAKPPETPRRPKRHAALAAGLLVLVGVAAAVSWRMLAERAGEIPAVEISSPIRSIAVLPLENLSGDSEQEYFSDGMTDVLIGDLAKLGSLKVISRTSVMRYKQSDKSLPEIARELNVEGVVEGTVMRAGDRVRVTAQLVDARTDHHLWNERYERDLSDVLSLQSEIARSVAAQIQLELTPQEAARLTATRPVKPEAHDAYLRGLHALSPWASLREGLKAIELFGKAARLDPTFAEAHAALAFTYTRLGFWLLPPAEVMERARSAALRALALDEDSALAHVALAEVLYRYDWDWEGGRRELERAVALSPGDAWVLERYSIYLAIVGRFDESLAVSRRSVDAAPLDPRIRAEYAMRFHFARRSDRAREELLRVIDSDPAVPEAYMILFTVDLELGLAEEATWADQKFREITGSDAPWREEVRRGYREGQSTEDRIRAWLSVAVAHRDEVTPPIFAYCYAYLGENDLAFEWAEQMYERRDPSLVLLPIHPMWDPVRSDPRFDDLLRRINYPGAS
jgi:TolB-like protein/class 3 adenylate cyclase/Tfp pilus assembly protein PilF